MKRYLLCSVVLALVFCLGGYGGISWYKQMATSDSPVHDDSHIAYVDQIREVAADVAVSDEPISSTLFQPPPYFEPLPAPPQFAPSNTAQAIAVADRSRIRDIRPVDPPQPEHFAQARFEPAPFDQFDSAAPGPQLPPVIGSPSINPIRGQAAPSLEVVNLMDGMSYLIRVDREDNSPVQKIKMQRMYGGKRTEVLDLPEQHSIPELRIFAEAVEVTSKDGEFQLKCEGKVAVVANQSMLWGEGLELENGVFKITEAEVVTPDAVIKSGGCEFEFAVGGISVDRIDDQDGNDDTGEEEAQPSIDTSGRFGGQ